MILSARRHLCVLLTVLSAAFFCDAGFAEQQAGTGTKSAAATAEKIHAVEICLPPPVVVKGEARTCKTLDQRMAELHIPGVSIAVVHNGSLEWARGYGVKTKGGAPVTTETIFQAGSISKPVAALGALRLVQEGTLSLDANVNDKLVSWKIPPSPAAPNAVVTLRELLTHTAGFTVHGFPGYAAGEPVPSLVQVLNGTPPANTPAIRLESVPGEKWNYSGGGFTVMQQLVVDVTKEPYPKFLQDTVLGPMHMTHSTYQQPLPPARMPQAAQPYNEQGVAVPGGPHTYPEMAAAGLWTNPSDLALYIMEIQQSLAGRANHVLSAQMVRDMLSRGKGGWGLGVQIGGSTADPYFTHGGVNEGYESLFAAYAQHGDGAIIMTNAQGGIQLASEVMSAIATVYNWPDFRPVERTQIKLDQPALARFAGTYEFTPQFSINVDLEGDQLMEQATGQSRLPLFPEAPDRFFLKAADVELQFEADAQGKVTGVVLHQGEHEAHGRKK